MFIFFVDILLKTSEILIKYIPAANSLVGIIFLSEFIDFTILLSPYAPHIAEEVWEKLGYKESITKAVFPKVKKEYLIEENIVYPVSFNGKKRFIIESSHWFRLSF